MTEGKVILSERELSLPVKVPETQHDKQAPPCPSDPKPILCFVLLRSKYCRHIHIVLLETRGPKTVSMSSVKNKKPDQILWRATILISMCKSLESPERETQPKSSN